MTTFSSSAWRAAPAVRRALAEAAEQVRRRRAEEALGESEARLRHAQQIANVGSWEWDIESGALLWSEQVYRQMGETPGRVPSSHDAFRERIIPEDRPAFDTAIERALADTASYDLELRIVRPDGVLRVLHTRGEVVRGPDGRPRRMVGVSIDITERKQAEEALREWNATLESKVAERTAQLQRRTRQLQKLALELSQAEERERRRIAVLLHEDLQQQIAGAKFQLNLVRSRTRDDRLCAEVDKVDEMLHEAIEKSRSLSYDLSPAVLHMNDLAEVLQWLVNQVRARHGLVVNVNVLGDMMLHSEALATFLFRAAQEMLFNVIKHARVKEARIRVRRVGRCVCLSVSDQGQGFDPQELKETSGIGLFSIRERTEMLGGRMKVKSTKGQGSRLSIMVPDSKPMVAPPPSGVSIPQPGAAELHSDGRLRVLLVDDHDIVRQGLAALLREAAGIELVGEASDGRSAINLAIDLRPDVVIMDVSMPLMSGDQATRQIKTCLPNTRVIALSMYDEADKKEEDVRGRSRGLHPQDGLRRRLDRGDSGPEHGRELSRPTRQRNRSLWMETPRPAPILARASDLHLVAADGRSLPGDCRPDLRSLNHKSQIIIHKSQMLTASSRGGRQCRCGRCRP